MLARWQPPVMKSLGGIDNLPGLADVVPAAKLIQRFWWDQPYGTDNFMGWNSGYGNPVEAWVGMFDNDFRRQQGHPQLYIESFNEVGLPDEYLRFETERVYMLQERYGLKSTVINTAVGTTSAGDWARAKSIGLLDAVRATGSLIGLHAYAGMFMTLWHGSRNVASDYDNQRLKDDPLNLVFRPIIPYSSPEGVDSWLAFRCRQDHEALRSLGYGDLKFVLTEFGIDNAGVQTYKNYTAGKEYGGWKLWVDIWRQLGFLNYTNPEEFYADQLLWADKQLLEYPFVEGATIFTYGSDPGTLWVNFDIRGTVAERLIDKIVTNESIKTSFEDYLRDVVAQPVEPSDTIIIAAPTIPPGPGAIHTTPDYHFIILPSEIESQWFFESEAAQRYMAAFQPELFTLDDLDYIEFLPNTVSLMATVIATPPMMEIVRSRISLRWLGVGMDAILIDNPSQMADILASRTAVNRRFG
jgi:hypothetical protein